MPRKGPLNRLEPYESAASLSVEPPPDLSVAARSVWVELVSAHDSDHFHDGDATLMAQYCEAASLAQKAAKGLQDGDSAQLKLWERATSIMASLALRLRLGPQSRRERAKAPKATGSWMDEFADAQERLRQQSRRNGEPR
jgi:hypothetical protein